jgi:hypothetical protein
MTEQQPKPIDWKFMSDAEKQAYQAKVASDVRPSPYWNSGYFRLTVAILRISSVIWGFVGLLLCALLPYSEGGTLPGIAVCFALAALIAAVDYVVRLLADIEQHTFRSAQMLDRIVASQSRKPRNDRAGSSRTGANVAS